MIYFIDFCLTVLTKIIVSGKIGIIQFTVTLVFNLITQRETCQSLILSACRRIRISGSVCYNDEKYSLQGTTQGRYLTGGVPLVRFSM